MNAAMCNRYGVRICIVVLCLLCLPSLTLAEKDTFYVSVDGNGQAEGGGSGYNGGTWYWYPNSEWWNQWFYNIDDPNGKKTYNIQFNAEPLVPGQATWVTVAVNWATEQWTSSAPPLPDDVSQSLAYENQIIGRTTLFNQAVGEGGVAYGGSGTLTDDFCPKWVSIDVTGYNFRLRNGYFEHECIIEEPPQDTEACCFMDGSCQDLTPQECAQQLGNAQGPGTTCATTDCPLPEFVQACCLPDGSCTITTPETCQMIGGIPQGVGVDCGMVDCNLIDSNCTWTVNHPHKMHWPQIPRPGGWDVDFASSVLADDWQCSESGPVEDIHLWISWRSNLKIPIDLIKVAIYSDISDPDGDGPYYSMPGTLLWEDTFQSGEFTVRDMENDLQGWFHPMYEIISPQDHVQWQQIDICNIPQPFTQELGSIYWLAVSFPSLTNLPIIGWKESDNHFNDGAVWLYGNTGPWFELRDPLSLETIDLAFVITGEGQAPPESTDNLKWEQPPMEWDPLANTPTYCGWDEPAYAVTGTSTTNITWYMVADDFRCLGSMPITSVHWWGSYQNWIQTQPPVSGPDKWRIAFWTNGAPSTAVAYSHPRRLLWIADVDADDVTIDYVGDDRFIDSSVPQDTCFRYDVDLKPNQVFWQDQYTSNTDDNIFWISITALYNTDTIPVYVWGWKTRPASWMDHAVTFEVNQSSMNMDMLIGADECTPITNNLLCGEGFDMAFSLDTDPNYVKWEQPFTGLRDWAHYEDEESYAGRWMASSIAFKWTQSPDLGSTGLAVDNTRDVPPMQNWDPQILADDFECTFGGPIRGIEIWGSWYDDVLPDGGADDLTFILYIHEDIPASSSSTGFSMPGKMLWTKIYNAGSYSVFNETDQTQAFYSPCHPLYSANDHQKLYHYSFGIDANEAFVQEGTSTSPKVYWLCVQAQVIYPPSLGDPILKRFGWMTSTTNWNDAAVWAQANGTYEGTWGKLTYPAGHTHYNKKQLDLAFQITTSSQSSGELIQRQVADDWQCDSVHPITAAVWWGSYVDHKYQPCQCQVLPEPNKPDYFLLSIWSDVPDSYPSNPNTFSKPGQLLWEYRAYDYDEVMVGYDKYPEGLHIVPGREAVYRYAVCFPRNKWFWQPGLNNIYWFSVVAVYDRDVTSLSYPWGWTNHDKVFNDNAVAGVYASGFWGDLTWQPLFDQTQQDVDMSFMLFTDPNEYLLIGPVIDPNLVIQF